MAFSLDSNDTTTSSYNGVYMCSKPAVLYSLPVLSLLLQIGEEQVPIIQRGLSKAQPGTHEKRQWTSEVFELNHTRAAWILRAGCKMKFMCTAEVP